MRTPVPPPCPPRAKIATTDGDTLATTATRSASDLRTSPIWARAGTPISPAARATTPAIRRIIMRHLIALILYLHLGLPALQALRPCELRRRQEAQAK